METLDAISSNVLPMFFDIFQLKVYLTVATLLTHASYPPWPVFVRKHFLNLIFAVLILLRSCNMLHSSFAFPGTIWK